MIDEIFNILNTLTDEALNVSAEKAKELGFDVDRGIISLHESFINLNSSKLLLIDAIEKEKLIQLPITVQKQLLTIIKQISKSLTGLTAGTDEVENIVNAIEKLNTAIWQFGMHNLSDEVLGYQTKQNQLKNLEMEIAKIKKDLQDGLNVKDNLEKLLSDSQTVVESIQSNLNDSEESVTSIAEVLEKSVDADQQIAAKLATIEQNDDLSTKHLSTTKASSAEVTALETKIKEFYAEVDKYKDKITTAENNATKAVNENTTATEDLIKHLQQLEDQIKDQLQKATGYSLFHSFQTRKDTLVRSKWIWAGAIGLLLCATAYWSYWLSSNTETLDTAFYLRLSLSIPLIYAITFCTSQYSHERKLEEEYAFKSNISVSLIPYKELVDKITDDEKPEEKEKYSSFMIESINKVFTSPVDKVFDDKGKQKGLGEKELKKFLDLLKPILKGQ